MFIKTIKIKTEYTRTSKLGKSHAYSKTKTIAVFQCDSCSTLFERPSAKMDPKRVNNEYSHVCPNCDSKRFAQKKGVERRRLWDTPIDKIGRL